jgi:pSer/pThr/pTyr-binding forkhead associated (FHA) protein
VNRRSPLAPHASTPAELQARIEASRAGTPFMVYRDAEGRQQIVDMRPRDERVTVGRRESNPIALEWDPDVSRVHAELENVGGDWTISDDGLSRNGTYVNGERVSGRRRLHDGDAIRVGDTLLVYCAPAERDSVPTRAGADLPVAGDLSDAQRRVLLALCRPFGKGGGAVRPATNHEIASELFLSIDAVKTHLRALFHKFGIEDLPQNEKRAQLAWRALQSGVVSARELWE